MAHVIVEYSANLRSEVDLPRLLRALHASALATGIFPVGGLRTRAYEAEHFCIADGHPDNAFVHVMLRVGHGRDIATRKQTCEAVFGSLCDELAALSERLPLGLSLEMQEIDPVLTMKKNNLHAYVQKRAVSRK
jgi:5-carboxymethyl-2-hydroxymuconate isomerase